MGPHESGCSFVKWSHMVKNDIYPKTTLIYGHFELWPKKKLALAISYWLLAKLFSCILWHEGGLKPILGHLKFKLK